MEQAYRSRTFKDVGKVYVSRWFLPYIDGRPAFKRHDGMIPGVYLIMNTNSGKIHYVGFSGGRLYDTMYRHFQRWDEGWRQHSHATYGKNGPWNIKVVKTANALAAVKLEAMLIRKYNPPDNKLNAAADDLPSPWDFEPAPF
jgi:hypothetical protein